MAESINCQCTNFALSVKCIEIEADNSTNIHWRTTDEIFAKAKNNNIHTGHFLWLLMRNDISK